MNVKRVLLPALVLFAIAQAASAASEGGTKFSVFASVYTAEDYEKADGVGFRVSFGGDIAFELTTAYYTTFDSTFDQQIGDVRVRDVGIELDVIPIDAGIRFKVGAGPIYVAFGGTYYLLDADGATVDDEVGLYGNFGVQFSHFYAEAGYREVDGELEDFPVPAGVVLDEDPDVGLSGFFVNVGWRF
jgi:hypothetical protein